MTFPISPVTARTAAQYLAFIYAYSRMFRRPPAEADMQRHFRVSPPSVHQMVLTIERAGLSDANPASPEASSYLLPRKICPSQNDRKSTSQDLCAEVLAANTEPPLCGAVTIMSCARRPKTVRKRASIGSGRPSRRSA